MVVGVAVRAADSASVTATVTPQIISVSVSTSTISYGILNVGETSASSTVITATNGGNVAEKFEIKGSNSANWTLSSTSTGADIFKHEFATDDSSYLTYTALDSALYATLDTSVSAPSGTQLFKLRLKMPSSTSVTTEQSTTVTVLATAV